MQVQEAEKRFAQWLRATRDLSGNTLRAYAGDIAAFRNHVGPHSRVMDISGDTIVSFVETQRAGGLSPASIRRRLAALRGFVRWLLETEALEIDPWAQLSLKIRRPRTLPRPVQSTDLTLLLAHLAKASELSADRSPRAGLPRPHETTTLLAVVLMLATGLRVAEVTGIRCPDIDLADSSIRVRGKGSRERIVFFPDNWMQQLIEAYLQTRDHIGVPHTFLLFNRTGAPVTPAAIRARLQRAVGDAGLPHRVTPHMFRHSAATQLIESGVDIRYVQRLLGHASLSTTELYTHVSDTSLRRMMTEANVLSRCLTRDN
jgi:site-specific recombinase XerD